MKQEPKPIIVKKSVKHTFSPEEVATLNVDFGNAYDAVKSAEADFDAVKAVHKAKIQEAESKMTTLRATINAGFDFRETELYVVFRPADKKKDFYLPQTAKDMLVAESFQDVFRSLRKVEVLLLEGFSHKPILTEDMPRRTSSRTSSKPRAFSPSARS